MVDVRTWETGVRPFTPRMRDRGYLNWGNLKGNFEEKGSGAGWSYLVMFPLHEERL